MICRPLTLLLLNVALVGCAQAAVVAPTPLAPAPAAPVEPAAMPAQVVAPYAGELFVTATGTLAPLGSDGRALLAVVSPWTSADIHHVDLTLSMAGTPVTTVSVAQADLANQVSFTNLKKTTTYSILARAYNTADSSAPIDNSGVSLPSCTTTFTTTSDTVVAIGNIALQLTNKIYSGSGDSNLSFTAGAVLNPGGSEGYTFFPRTFSMTTVAGTLPGGYGGDGGLATAAQFNNPRAIAFDSAGNMFVADQANGRIRKITAGTGVITSVVSSLNLPSALAIDAADNLYFADSGNGRVKKLDKLTSAISIIAGNGSGTYMGGEDGQQAVNASLSFPSGLALDGAGALYISDQAHARIRKVVLASGIITTVAGTGAAGFLDHTTATSAQFNVPTGLARDGAGNLYIAEAGNHRIRKLSAAGAVTTVAGNGTLDPASDGILATSASIIEPYHQSVDGAGNLYIADFGHYRIRKVNTAGIITTVAGNGVQGFLDSVSATSGRLDRPLAVTFDSTGALFIADYANQRIRKLQ